ncbi:hypothetical protein [Natronobacterium gregoryi]|uniref:Uncharacterized protein n=2 Tax=Natronobacterium gregoryi TaxID=44930 RepID=L0ALI0_NATGS|nr:hypothetical protein [Natronobacterium gregoryi]AFZ74047.1 hypothetical protein Natgr_2909 [Natronobacterium gregoryi SP2]ELY70390.1 hypothetical protein C490_06574 [Natronobacterium gregoryi SP2]PLK20792.1 hypothetical protein CYV19_07735 [Natronobacterium gregoryi SP2]SFJ06849.1 hypothetical protein SAMN05443661_11333 [Natronobacterium gregoryi]
MRPFDGETPQCKRCGYELEGDEVGCPGCGFNPRQMGLRVSMAFLLLVVGSMTGVMFTTLAWPTSGPVLLGITAVSFGLAVVTFVVSFLATPSRLGSVFVRF